MVKKIVDFDCQKSMLDFIDDFTEFRFDIMDIHLETYSNEIPGDKLSDNQNLTVKILIDEFNVVNNPYYIHHCIKTNNLGLFMLDTSLAGPTLKALDFLTFSSFIKNPELREYCETLLNFDHFCNDLTKQYDDFRRHNENELLMP